MIRTALLKTSSKRFAAKIAYDGTNYCGWQIQVSGISIQEIIEKALSDISKSTVKVTGSGRTDSGVHALAQIAHFDFPVEMTPAQLRLALQTKLPHDIQIDGIFEVSPDFNARFDAFKRTYIYHMGKYRTPFNRLYKSFFIRKNLDPQKFKECLPYFIGENDFFSFSRPNPDIKSTICNVEQFTMTETEEEFLFTISANRFLHNMVRRIIGTIVVISDKDLPASVIPGLFSARSHDQKLIVTSPPQGLFLSKVEYPDYTF